MKVSFQDKHLEDLFHNPNAKHHFPHQVVSKFRKTVQWIDSAVTPVDVEMTPGCRFKRLKGARRSESSLRLNDQFRLVFSLTDEDGYWEAKIIAVEDYH